MVCPLLVSTRFSAMLAGRRTLFPQASLPGAESSAAGYPDD